jgi:hypothetical protein
MLAKQVWRLINTPDSLCARVLRSKYYSDGDILKAGPKSGSSFTWQSILAGMATLKRGYTWRVGNGEKINIYNDPWIPSSPDRKIISPRGEGNAILVSELTTKYGAWNEEKLIELFNMVDVNRIMEIPLNNHGFDDFIAWNFSTNGQVLPPTVASQIWSGYHLQWRHKFGPSASQLAIPGLAVSNPVWQIIWKLKVPNKVKIFIWRAMHGIVPLKAILAIDMWEQKEGALFAIMRLKTYYIWYSNVPWQRTFGNC